jgi:peroxiredoxin
MKHLRPALVFFSAVALCASPLLASSFDGQTKKKDPPKKDAPHKDPPKAPEKKPDPKPAEAKPLAVGGELDGATTLNDTAGKTHSMKEYRGKITVLAMWSSATPGSAQEKRLAKIAADFGAKGVSFLAVASVAGENGDAKALGDAATKAGVTFPVLMDKGSTLAEHLGAKAVDEVFVLDAKGILRYSGSIDDDPKGEKADKAQDFLTPALKALADGKDVTPATTAPNGGTLKLEPHKAPAPANPPKK